MTEQHALKESGRINEAARYSFDFEEVATSVEERFRRAYNETMGTAKTEGQVEYNEVSIGWWLVLKRLGISMWISHDKPAFESGDLLKISIQKRDIP